MDLYVHTNVYEGGIRTPCLIRSPAGQSGGTPPNGTLAVDDDTPL